jgi:hypothetical protein
LVIIMHPFRAMAVLIGLVAASPNAALAKSVALVIGNSGYQYTSKLPNPRNDAADIAAVLKKLGFQVIDGLDLDKAAMDRKLREFAQALSGSDMSVFFYAGHGLQVGGQNYLIPVDAKLESASALDFEAVRLDLVHRTMEREAQTNVIFLDACRDNPLARNLARALGTRSSELGKGLAAVEAGAGTLISFSTQPGNVAFDGEGRNSPFAGALLKHIAAPGEDLSSMLITVRNEVMQATANRQVPWEHSALRTRFYFSPANAPQSAPANPTLGLTYEQQSELAFWNSVKDSGDVRAIGTYLERFPNGVFNALARVRIERLKEQPTQTAAPSAAAASQSPEPEHMALARQLQAELARVGCDPGEVDGHWGAKARNALRAFAKSTQTTIDVEEPSRTALKAVADQTARVCSLSCPSGESGVNGRCVATPSRKVKQVGKLPRPRSTESAADKRPRDTIKDSSLCERWRSGDPRAAGWEAYCR